MKITEKISKTIITKSNLPGADYVVNPYSGCAFGCVYCYADFMRKFTGHMDDQWGEYVDIKKNAVEIFSKEINKIQKESLKKETFKTGNNPVILFGSVTDPYQGVEAKYKLTRGCLEVVNKMENKDLLNISILTKSPLVTRDIDILKEIPNLEVGITITSTNDNISRVFEKNAPLSSLRIKALKELNEKDIKTYAFVGPLLPSFVKDKSELRNLFMQIKEAGTQKVWVEHINLSGNKMQRLINLIGDKLTKEEIYLL